MKKNMGLPDRIIRVVLATIAPVLYFSGIISGTLALILLLITALLLVTSFIKVCPFYIPFGITTDKKIKK